MKQGDYAVQHSCQNSQEWNLINKNYHFALKYGPSTSLQGVGHRELCRVYFTLFIPDLSFYYLLGTVFLRVLLQMYLDVQLSEKKNYQWVLPACTQAFLLLLALAGKDLVA